MRNKMKFILTSIIIFIVVSLIALFIKVQFFTVTVSEDESNIAIYEYSKSYEYMMKELDGKIGIYQGEELIDILDVLVSTLPEYDIQSLQEGILIKDYDELMHLIEAFDS